MVYGQNNAGKSAFVRIPALLAASRTPGREGLALLGAAVRGASFKEVRWRGDLAPDEDPDLVLGVELDDDSKWRWTLRWHDLAATSDIQRFTLSHGDKSADFERRHPNRLRFDGLVPQPGAVEFVDAYRPALVSALDGNIWLEAKRVPPSREGAARDAGGTFSSTGDDAAARVAADPRLRVAISRWFLEHTGCRVVVEALGSDRQRLVLGPSPSSYYVSFPDAGEGLQQVFPVVAALEHIRENGGLLCVEEPESHLHPGLQRALADLVVDVLRAQPSASILLETHSEVFLLAALKAATSDLHDATRLFWVEAEKDGAATLESIPLDIAARPTTPRLSEAFEVMGALRRELIHARRLRYGGG